MEGKGKKLCLSLCIGPTKPNEGTNLLGIWVPNLTLLPKAISINTAWKVICKLYVCAAQWQKARQRYLEHEQERGSSVPALPCFQVGMGLCQAGWSLVAVCPSGHILVRFPHDSSLNWGPHRGRAHNVQSLLSIDWCCASGERGWTIMMRFQRAVGVRNRHDVLCPVMVSL